MRILLLPAFAFLLAFIHGTAAEPLTLDLGSGVKMDLALIASGSFTQGSPFNEAGRGDDEAQRPVTLTQDFYLGQTAVTRAQWERFATETHYRTEAESGPSGGFGWDGSAMTQRKEFTWRNPGFAQTPDHPVCLITYADAQAFCQWLSRKTKRPITLPTEAQWEYAARAGADLNSTGTAWHKGNAGNSTHPVTSTQPNAWGLHISGNVAEWCADWYAPYDLNSVTDPLQTNANLSDKPRRILRGGSWARDAKNTRSAARFRADAQSRNADIGFRVVCSTQAAPTQITTSEVALPRMQPTSQDAPLDFNQSTTSAPRSFGVSLIKFLSQLPCILIPLGIVIFIVRKLIGNLKGNSSSVVNPLRPTDTTMNRSSAASSAQTRLVDDGFWLQMNCPHGTQIHYAYRPLGGMEVTDQLLYQPNAEGHFVYTGSKPESARVTSIGEVVDDSTFAKGSTTFDPGPGAGIGGSGFHVGGHSSSSISRQYPSAY